MVVLNEMSHYHLVLNALRRARRLAPGAQALELLCEAMLVRHHAYIREHLEDVTEVRDWTWPQAGLPVDRMRVVVVNTGSSTRLSTPRTRPLLQRCRAVVYPTDRPQAADSDS